jgi:hypothetical protein
MAAGLPRRRPELPSAFPTLRQKSPDKHRPICHWLGVVVALSAAPGSVKA